MKTWLPQKETLMINGCIRIRTVQSWINTLYNIKLIFIWLCYSKMCVCIGVWSGCLKVTMNNSIYVWLMWLDSVVEKNIYKKYVYETSGWLGFVLVIFLYFDMHHIKCISRVGVSRRCGKSGVFQAFVAGAHWNGLMYPDHPCLI